MYVYVCMCMYGCMCMYVYIYIYIYIHLVILVFTQHLLLLFFVSVFKATDYVHFPVFILNLVSL